MCWWIYNSVLVDLKGLVIPSDATLRQGNQGPQTNLQEAEGFVRGFATRSCRVHRTSRGQVLCGKNPFPAWKIGQTGRRPNWCLRKRSRQMDPEGSKKKLGTHKGLEQGDRTPSQGGDDQTASKTLQDAIDGFLDSKRSLKEFTLTNYRRQLQNQVTSVIPDITPLRELEWDRGGRAKVKELVTFIEDRGSYDQAFRVQKVLAQALDYAILQG